MTEKSSAQKSPRHSSRNLDSVPSAGPEGTAVTPPIYGIDFLDQASLQTESGPHSNSGSTLQRKVNASSSGTDTNEVPALVHEVLHSPGQPLDAGTRSFMEPRFGHDFSEVRVHADEKAAESTQTVNALAYTVGHDVVFGTGQYRPQTEDGKHLLAHELTHVVQQGAGVHLKDGINRANDPYEQTADTVADQVVQGKSNAISMQAKANMGGVIGITLQRRSTGSGRIPLKSDRKPEEPCCDTGKALRSAQTAKEDFEARRTAGPISKTNPPIKAQFEGEDGSKGPENVIDGMLSEDEDLRNDLHDLLYAASKDGKRLSCSSTYRDLEGQWLAFHNTEPIQHNPKAAARPGRSNHGTGRAIDFSGDLDWLLANAGKYGWVNWPGETWHYDHISTRPGIITDYRNQVASAGTTRKHSFAEEGRSLTRAEKTSLGSQYDDAQIIVALRWNNEQNFPKERWLQVQEYIGMDKKDRSGIVDKETIRAVIKWQKSKNLTPDGKVGLITLMALGIMQGWSGSLLGSINEQITSQGNKKSILRIPIEGLDSVKATFPEDPKEKGPVLGRALVLVPESVLKKSKSEKIEVLVHLHGHTKGYGVATKATKFGASPGQTEDLETDMIVQQLESSGRSMVAMLPQGTGIAEFGPGKEKFDSKKFIAEVLERLKRFRQGQPELGWKSVPEVSNISRTVLSGFSGGGDTISPMLAEGDQPRVSEKLNELILFDAIHTKAARDDILRFLLGKLEHDFKEIISKKDDEERKAYIQDQGFRFWGFHTGDKHYYGGRYQYIDSQLSAWFKSKKDILIKRQNEDTDNKSTRIKLNMDVEKRALDILLLLRKNYRVVYAESNRDHRTLMRTMTGTGERFLEKALSSLPADEI